jgi:membrane protease YdiL (CAAX protease family)
MPSAAAPRLWPTLTLLAVALPAFAIASGIVAVLSALAFGVDLGDGEALREHVATLAGVLTVLVPTQLLLGLVAVVPAAASPTPFAERLGLVKPRGSWRALAWVLIGTLGASIAMQWLAERFIDEPSAQLEMLGEMILGQEGLAAVLVILLLSVLPGLFEELVFRGYVQTRLERRLPAPLAIALPALAFALLHMDPQHVVLVFPLGLWLGFARWATGSTWSACLAHAAGNAFAMVLARALGDLNSWSDVLGRSYAGLAGAGVLALVAATVALLRLPRGATARVPAPVTTTFGTDPEA